MRDRYARVLRAPHVRALVVSSVLARLPIGIVALALILFVEEETGSFAQAGAVSGAFAVFGGLVAPLQGRLIDRLGQTRVLAPLVVVHTTALTAIIVAGLAGAPLGVLLVLASVAGGAIP